MSDQNNNIFFPFYTCEKPYNNNNYIAQTVSAIINIIACIILAYFLTKSKTKQSNQDGHTNNGLNQKENAIYETRKRECHGSR